MRYTYVASDNTGTGGTALGVDNQDIVVHSIIWGTPGDGEYAIIYDKVNPVVGAATNKAAHITQPTAAAGKDWVRVSEFPGGLRLGEGGNIVTNASQVTVIWESK
jgi:hypothetical protein